MEHSTRADLPDVCRRFMAMFGLRFPIIQASMDGPVAPPLITEVCNAGALGSLPLTWLDADQVAPTIHAVQAGTDGAFFGNYVLNFPPNTLGRAVEAGIGSILFSWGVPDQSTVDTLRDNSILIGVQVTGTGSARAAIDAGADFLVCQGIEAGGHVQAYQPLDTALAEVLSVAGDTPVAAAGGMASGADIGTWLSRGAAACVFGSRFVATRESVAHPTYKRMLLDATGDDTVLTVCLSKKWPNATHRIMPNSTFDMWEAAGCPQAGQRPGERDIIAEMDDDGTAVRFERYENNTPVEAMTGDDVMGLGTFAGLGVGQIADLPPAAELVARLWAEYEAAASQGTDVPRHTSRLSLDRSGGGLTERRQR